MIWRVAGAAVFGLGVVVGSAVPGPGLTTATAPPAGIAQPQAAGEQDVLRVLLAGVSGADPVVCELALMALDGRSFGWSDIRADVEGATLQGLPVRSLAEWVMRPPRDPRLVPPLRDALVGPDPCAARTAARLLGRMATEEAVAALHTTLRSADPVARRNAALGLGLAEDRDAVPALIDVLGADPDPNTRRAAAWALGKIQE